jgi:hypothetical protein
MCVCRWGAFPTGRTREWRRRKRSCFVMVIFARIFCSKNPTAGLWMCLWKPTCIRPRWGTCSWWCLWLSWTRWWRRGEFDVLNPEPENPAEFWFKKGVCRWPRARWCRSVRCMSVPGVFVRTACPLTLAILNETPCWWMPVHGGY